MPVRQTSWLALIAVFAIAGPFCGALAAVTCGDECCCGDSHLSSSCAEGDCMMSQPGAVHQVGVKAPELRVETAAEAPDTAESLTDATRPECSPAPELVEHSPPDILLFTQHFLN